MFGGIWLIGKGAFLLKEAITELSKTLRHGSKAESLLPSTPHSQGIPIARKSYATNKTSNQRIHTREVLIEFDGLIARYASTTARSMQTTERPLHILNPRVSRNCGDALQKKV